MREERVRREKRKLRASEHVIAYKMGARASKQLIKVRVPTGTDNANSSVWRAPNRKTQIKHRFTEQVNIVLYYISVRDQTNAPNFSKTAQNNHFFLDNAPPLVAARVSRSGLLHWSFNFFIFPLFNILAKYLHAQIPINRDEVNREWNSQLSFFFDHQDRRCLD